MGPDERELLIAIYEKPEHETVRDVFARSPISSESLGRMVNRWVRKNWYTLGVDIDLGQLTDVGMRAAKFEVKKKTWTPNLKIRKLLAQLVNQALTWPEVEGIYLHVPKQHDDGTYRVDVRLVLTNGRRVHRTFVSSQLDNEPPEAIISNFHVKLFSGSSVKGDA